MFEEKIGFEAPNPVPVKPTIKDILIKIIDNIKEIIIKILNIEIKTEIIVIFAATVLLLSVIYALVYYNTRDNIITIKNLESVQYNLEERNKELKETLQVQKTLHEKELEEAREQFQTNYNFQTTQHQIELEKRNQELNKCKDMLFDKQITDK